MEDIIGVESDDERFAGFLADWRAILAGRVAQVRDEMTEIDGIAAAVLAGSHGRDAPWPLSDIDVILITEVGQEERVRTAMAELRVRLTAIWAKEGWWTGLDAGRLLFSTNEVDHVIGSGRSPRLAPDDARWFHTMDKAFGGRALLDDPEARAAQLAQWATMSRFDPSVVRNRSARLRNEATAALESGYRAIAAGDWLPGTLALWRAVQLAQIAMMNGWSLRDNSLGRFGSRFRAAAREHGLAHVADELEAVSGLDPESIVRRALVAPGWVALRHNRSFRARRAIGEDIDRLADLRDTLRVCSRYAVPSAAGPDFPEWLAIVVDRDDLQRRLDSVRRIVDVALEPSSAGPD